MARQADRTLTLTERARRAQLIEVTIEVVAERGHAGASLARIAEGAGITKAAVLYHFASKDAVVTAAYEHVIGALTEQVGAAVEAAGPEGAPGAYVRAMICHIRENPRHTRMIIEAMADTGARANPAARWGPLAELLRAARAARGSTAPLDLRTVAIATGGAIDAVVAEHLADPGYDLTAAAELLATSLERTIFGEEPR